jgi:hypothetical protein
MRLTYCNGWSYLRKRPGEILSEEQAKRAHEDGTLYSVLVGDPERPDCLIHVRFEVGYVGVNFFDSELRVYLSYDFDKQPDDRMFLSAATTREFGGNSGNPSLLAIYRFFPDSRVLMRREYSDGHAEDAKSFTDVSGNWEAMPSFGKYDSLIRVERPPVSGMTATA